MTNRRDIYLRAHTAKHAEKPLGQPQRTAVSIPRWPDHVLIFDTETRTDVHQNLMFGFYRICKLVGDVYLCESEGVVYSDDITKEELNQIGAFVLNTFTDVEVKEFPPQVRLQVHRSFPDFMERVFWPAVRKDWMIVGFNLAFDISRLSLGRRRTRRGGFCLILSKQLDHKSQTWKSHPYYPEIKLEAKDARTTFITRRIPRFGKEKWPNRGRFLD